MVVSFDPDKSDRNHAARGLAFDQVDRFDWSEVLIVEDGRRHYGELQLLIMGYLDDRLHVAVVTPRDNDLRVISLRRAGRKEVRFYEQEVRPGGRTP